MKDNSRREEILSIAEELFAEKGFEGVSMNDIAERVDMQKSALYYYFKSKKDIYDSLIKEIYIKLQDKVREPVLQGKGREEKIRLLISHLIDFWAEHPRFPVLITREVLSNGELVTSELIPQFWLPMFSAVVGDLSAESAENEDVQDMDMPLLVINVFGISSFYFFVAPILKTMTGEDYYSRAKIEKLKGEVIKMIFNGIGKKGAT